MCLKAVMLCEDLWVSLTLRLLLNEVGRLSVFISYSYSSYSSIYSFYTRILKKKKLYCGMAVIPSVHKQSSR